MKPVARVLIVAMLVAFAAASTVHAAGTAAMDIKMTMAADGMDMDGCDSCGNAGDGKLACDAVCIAPLLAIASPDAPLRDAAPETFDDVGAEGIVGQTGPPDPYPPRSFIVS